MFVSQSCAIKLSDSLIITGGISAYKTVSKYDKNGWVMDLTSMNTGRRLHGCGHYYSDTNELVKADIYYTRAYGAIAPEPLGCASHSYLLTEESVTDKRTN